MSLAIPHATDTTPAWWTTERGATILRCPNGHELCLRDASGGREIGENGEVQFPVRCLHLGCNFHRTVLLVGWKE